MTYWYTNNIRFSATVTATAITITGRSAANAVPLVSSSVPVPDGLLTNGVTSVSGRNRQAPATSRRWRRSAGRESQAHTATTIIAYGRNRWYVNETPTSSAVTVTICSR